MSVVSPALQAVGSGITRLMPHEPAPQLRCPAPERLRRHRTRKEQADGFPAALQRPIRTVAAAPDMAMAGGTQPEYLTHALSGVGEWVRTRT